MGNIEKRSKHLVLTVLFLVVMVGCATVSQAKGLSKKDKKIVAGVAAEFRDSLKKTGPRKEKLFKKWVAHRGCSDLMPENTAAAYELAGMLDAYAIEGDVVYSDDNVLFMAHPLESGKLPQLSLKKKIRGYKWKTLAKAKIKKGVNVKKFKKVKLCTFTEYLRICKKYDCIAVVDIKNIRKSRLKKITKKIYKTIKKEGMVRKCYVISKNMKIIKEINKLSKHTIPVGIYSNQLDKIDMNQYRSINPRIMWNKAKFSDDPITVKVKA